MEWRYTLDLRDLWKELQDPDSEAALYQHLGIYGRKIVDRIRKAPFYGEFEDQSHLERICQAFEHLDENSSDDDFNLIYHHLCDWADRDRRVWVQTLA